MMMKRALIGVLLVLAMTSWAAATPILQINAADVNVNGWYKQGSTIQINLYDAGNVTGAEYDAITDTTYPSAPLGSVSSDAFSGSWTNTYATTLNADNLLVEWESAVMSSGTISGILYDFKYVVPNLTNGTDVTITTVQGTSNYYVAETDYSDAPSYTTDLTLTLQVGPTPTVPEPASMLLLGLGGLLLRRRK